jgi:hypothetical protein
VGDGQMAHVYVTESVGDDLIRRLHLDSNAIEPNVTMHLVPDDVWPYDSEASHVPPFVAWLDLADEDDRAAHTLLARLVS